MPDLNIQYGGDGLAPKACFEVAQDEWAFSDDTPLATIGAGPCMNVVVHAGTAGCLAHIWNSSISQKEIYDKACRTIGGLIGMLKATTDIEIWLGAGSAFHLGSIFFSHPKTSAFDEDFVAYLRRYLKRGGFTVRLYPDDRIEAMKGSRDLATIHDYRVPTPNVDWDPGDIAYDPRLGTIYLLKERGGPQDLVFAVQTGKAAKIRGKCK